VSGVLCVVTSLFFSSLALLLIHGGLK
jgi:hypothetical protein